MKILKLIGVLGLATLLVACGGGGGGVACGNLFSSACGGSTPPNTAPKSIAGAIQNVTLDVPVNGILTKLVTLDGSGSTDAETINLNLKYKWTLEEKPGASNAVLSNADTVRPTFVADAEGVYKFKLVVNDGKLDNVNTDTNTVSVYASITNSRPVADAGPTTQYVVYGPQSIVMLDGTASKDDDKSDPRIYEWTLQVPKASNSTAKLSDPSSPRPTFTADKLGEYIATLVVSDGKQKSLPVSVVIVATVENRPPTADAGVDQSVTLKSADPVTIYLDGTKSSDPDNDKLTYAWTWLSYPGTTAPTIDATSPRPSFSASTAYVYVLALTVYDGKKYSSPDPVAITVNSINSPPTAVAGVDQYVTVSTTNTISLDGSASFDPDKDTFTCKWWLSSPPEDVTTSNLTGSTTCKPSFRANVAGVYVASLVVTDSKGNTSSVSQTRITASTGNSPPVANAGPLQTVTGATLVNLTGAGSTDADAGDVLTYKWTIQSKPDASSSTLALTDATTSTPSFTPDAVGVYVIKLIVNDGKVDSAPHTVTIIRSAS